MSLASTNPHEMLPAETAAGPVEMIDSYRTRLLGPGVRGRHRDIWRTLVHMELTALGFGTNLPKTDSLGGSSVRRYLGWDLILPCTQFKLMNEN